MQHKQTGQNRKPERRPPKPFVSGIQVENVTAKIGAKLDGPGLFNSLGQDQPFAAACSDHVNDENRPETIVRRKADSPADSNPPDAQASPPEGCNFIWSVLVYLLVSIRKGDTRNERFSE